MGKSLNSLKPGRYFMKINYYVLAAVIFMCLDKMLLVRLGNWF